MHLSLRSAERAWKCEREKTIFIRNYLRKNILCEWKECFCQHPENVYVCVYVVVGATAWAATSGCWKAFLEGWVWFSCRILILLSGVANMRPELNCTSSWTGGWVLPLYSISREESASFLFWSWIMKENPFDCQILSWLHVCGSNFACGTLILGLRVTPNVSL